MVRPKAAAVGSSVVYDYVEVMACPGGCTNGGGQVGAPSLGAQREWLESVERRFYECADGNGDGDGVLEAWVEAWVEAWERETGVPREKLLYTSYRVVENDIGGRMVEEVTAADLAGKAGGGW